jgi:transcriptional regulator with XRE-family HTH domain
MVVNVVRKAREGAGLTQSALAVRAGCSETTIRSLEAGRLGLGGKSIERLAPALGMEIPELLGWHLVDLASTIVAEDPRVVSAAVAAMGPRVVLHALEDVGNNVGLPRDLRDRALAVVDRIAGPASPVVTRGIRRGQQGPE